MAKSARASATKANRTAFRQKISGPREMARAERLSARLQEIASKPKLIQDEKMEEADTVIPVNSTTQAKEAHNLEENMDVDGDVKKPKLHSTKTRAKKGATRIQKKRRGKERNQIAFKKGNQKRSGNVYSK